MFFVMEITAAKKILYFIGIATMLGLTPLAIASPLRQFSQRRAPLGQTHFLNTRLQKGRHVICLVSNKKPTLGIFIKRSGTTVVYRSYRPVPGEATAAKKARRECLIKGAAPQCADGIDNDADGIEDFPKDSDCTSKRGDYEGAHYGGFVKPFEGDYPIGSLFDHEYPLEFISVNGDILSSYHERTTYGVDGHQGYDFTMDEGTPILAASVGTVEFAGREDPFYCPLLGQTVSGIFVRIRHALADQTLVSLYLHLSSVTVTEGDVVNQGALIGYSGNTGCSTGPHLHFDVQRRLDGNRYASIDPYGWNGAGAADPWETHSQGSKSFRLWDPGSAPAEFLGFALAPNPNHGDNASIALTYLQFAGPLDRVTPNNEFVELSLDTRYAGRHSYDLSGFRLRDNAGNTFTFPKGSSISSAHKVRVYSGKGTSTATKYYWGRADGAWNNSTDCAHLFSADGSLMYRLSYGSAACTTLGMSALTAPHGYAAFEAPRDFRPR